jgi:hypothetical protein
MFGPLSSLSVLTGDEDELGVEDGDSVITRVMMAPLTVVTSIDFTGSVGDGASLDCCVGGGLALCKDS